uniref:Uncharacterized protein ycf68 n=1 Tax=Brassica campestris TaxID=3711 RepID=M4FJ62_BRACM
MSPLWCGGMGMSKGKGWSFSRFWRSRPPFGRPARRAISSVVERAPDNCVVVPGLRIDGAIQVRSNVDPTFYSLVGSGRSGGDHHGSSLLENPYIPYQCMESYLSSTG